MKRPAGVQVVGQFRSVPTRALGNPRGHGGDDARPALRRGTSRGPTNGCRGETDHLIAAFPESDLAEAALHFRPLVPVGRTQLVRVVLERLMQDGQNHEGDAAGAGRDLRKGLQQVDIASRVLLRGVLQRLAGFVDHQQQAGSGLRCHRPERFLEAPDDVGCRAPRRLRTRLVQVLTDRLQHPRLRSSLSPPDGVERRTQGLEQKRVQGRTLGGEDHRMQPLARKGNVARLVQELPSRLPAG